MLPVHWAKVVATTSGIPVALMFFRHVFFFRQGRYPSELIAIGFANCWIKNEFEQNGSICA